MLYLCVALADKVVARDEVRNDSLGPGFWAFALVERHHQLPQMRLAALCEILQHTTLRRPGFNLKNAQIDREFAYLGHRYKVSPRTCHPRQILHLRRYHRAPRLP